MPGGVDDDAADRVARHRGATAAHRHGSAGFGRERHRGGQIVGVGRHHNEVGDHAVVRSVDGVEAPAGRVVAHRPAEPGPQSSAELARVVGRAR